MKSPLSAIEAAETAGIDLSLADENLRLTPEQRAMQHDAALDLVLRMEAAGRRLRNADHSATKTPSRN
jgi:pheromone shutdown protein TraB